MLQIDKEYAAALFEIALEENKTDEYLQELVELKSLVEENPEYLDFLGSPAIPLAERLEAIESAFSENCAEYVVSFLKLLCENGRIRVLVGAIEEFARLCMVHSNKTTARIYSAVALSNEQKNGVESKLEKLTGKAIEAVYIIDESLIGGLKIEVEGKTYDGSIRHRLLDVKEGIV